MFSLSINWSWSKSYFILLLFIVAPGVTDAQILQTGRVEIPLGDKDEEFEIMQTGTSGLYLTRSISAGNGFAIQLLRLDTALQQKWTGILPMDPTYRMVAKKTVGDNLYILSRFPSYSRNDLVLYVVDESSGQYKIHRIKSYIPFAASEFQVANESVLIGGYFNNIPIVIYYNLATLQSKVVPGLFNEAGELNQIRTHSDGSFDLLITAKNINKQYTVFMKSYDSNATLLLSYALEPEAKTNLLFARSLKSDTDKQIIAGVFGNRNKDYSKGMFIATVEPSGLQNIRYYYYGDLKNFFKYMKAKREARVRNRIERKKVKGKRARFSYRFLVHELINHNDQFILLGEAFYPRYKNIERGYGGFMSNSFGSLPIQNGRIFDGYSYTHAVVMGFNANGDLLWDNSFEINDVRTFTLEQFVKLQVLDDRIALAYQYQNQIRTKIIKDDQVLEGKTSDPISTFRSNEIVKKQSSGNGKLEYWYDGFLYASGTQEYITRGKSSNGRKVFYINKLTFEK